MALLLCIFTGSLLHAAPGTDTLPASLRQKLTRLQQQNRLSDWINARLDYVDENPAARIDILMRTPRETWRTYNTYAERLTWFDMLALQGYYQLELGNILASIEAYENALQFYESYPLPDAQIIEYVLKPLGNNYTRLADYGMALNIHTKTLALAQKQQPATIPSIYSNMAVCARWQGDMAAATAYCRKALQLEKDNTPLYGLLLNTYADILAEEEKYDSAVLFCAHALNILRHHQQDEQVVYWYGSALQQMAYIALRQKHFTIASDYAHKAAALYLAFYPTARQREKAKLDVLKGNIYLQSGDAVKAGACFHQALTRLLSQWRPGNDEQPPPQTLLYGENTIGDALEGKAKVLRSMGKGEVALQYYIAAITAQIRLRQEFFYTESKLKEIQLARTRADAAMQLAFDIWINTKNKKYMNMLLQIAELSKAQLLLEEKQYRQSIVPFLLPGDSLLRKERQLQQAITYYKHELLASGGKTGQSSLLQKTEHELALLEKNKRWVTFSKGDNGLLPTPESLCRSIPDSTTVLEFFEGKDTSYVLEITREGIQKVGFMSSAASNHRQIQQFIQRWFSAGPAAMINDPHTFFKENYSLYHAIIGAREWKPTQRYLLIPDGIFNYLPFDALITDSNHYSNNYAQWPWLYRQAILSKAYSLQTWQAQQAASYTVGSMAGFFVEQDKTRQQVALTTKQEYNILRRKQEGHFYFNTQATTAALNGAIEKAGILHISAHAFTQPVPYLQLYDGAVYLSDLQYRYFAPSLVVLGACHTADGALLQGEGVNSLERGFIAAGAGGVLASLWNVNDETAGQFSALFYQQLKQQPDAALALYETKKEWLQLHADQSLLQLPYYWAAFTYSGHLQRIPMQQSYTRYFIAIPAILLMSLSVIILVRQRSKKRKFFL